MGRCLAYTPCPLWQREGVPDAFSCMASILGHMLFSAGNRRRFNVTSPLPGRGIYGNPEMRLFCEARHTARAGCLRLHNPVTPPLRKEGRRRGTGMASNMVVALVVWSMFCGAVVQAQNFDFFYFVQQWPGSYCDTRQGCCFPLSSNPKAVFGIHGLWPNFNDGSYPASCGNEPYNAQEVADVLQKMDDDWGSLACPSSDSQNFWNHEWSKHGTCSGLSQHDYFQSAINLYGNYDITAALANAGIVPDGSKYQIEDIRKAIGSVLNGHLPGVDCNKDGEGNKQLYQIYICVATDGSTLIDCPIFPNNECNGAVEFPVFDPSSKSVQ